MSVEKNFVSQLMTAIATYVVDLRFYISQFLLHSTVSKLCKFKKFLVSFYTFFVYISILLAKAPGFNLGKKLSNFLSNREGLN